MFSFFENSFGTKIKEKLLKKYLKFNMKLNAYHSVCIVKNGDQERDRDSIKARFRERKHTTLFRCDHR